MALAPGARLGPYETLDLIGEGDKGDVYRACDTRLNRTVALKVLPTAFAADPDRRARFERCRSGSLLTPGVLPVVTRISGPNCAEMGRA